MDTTEAVHLKGVYVKRHPMNYVILPLSILMKKNYSTASHLHLLTVELEGVPKVKIKKKNYFLWEII